MVLRVGALQCGVGDVAAFDQVGEADQLAELTFQVQPVALFGDHEHIALTAGQHFVELFQINIIYVDLRNNGSSPLVLKYKLVLPILFISIA